MPVLTHKIKLSPTVKQRVQLANTAGCARYAYNWALERWEELFRHGESCSKEQLCRLWVREKPEWARETSFKAQQRAILELGTAFDNYFSGRARRPRFKKKGVGDSFYAPNDAVMWFPGRRVSVPRVGRVKAAEECRFSGKILSYRVVRDCSEWYLCVNVDTAHELPGAVAPASIVGVDVGISHAATASDGSVLDLPTSLKKLERRKRRQQRALSKSTRTIEADTGKNSCKRYSKNGQKKLKALQRTQRRINNIRKDAVHKWTTDVCKRHATVVVETLDINDMRKTESKSLRRLLSSSVMSEVLRQLGYKAQNLIKAPRLFASSKRCSNCGSYRDTLALSERVYTCTNCGIQIARDLNAAINLMQTPWVTREAPVEHC